MNDITKCSFCGAPRTKMLEKERTKMLVHTYECGTKVCQSQKQPVPPVPIQSDQCRKKISEGKKVTTLKV